jgi:hypothetical protein
MAFDVGSAIVLVLSAAFVGFLIWAELSSRHQRSRASPEDSLARRQDPKPPEDG